MFVKEFFEKVNFEKKSADDNKSMKLNILPSFVDDTLYVFNIWMKISVDADQLASSE